jgi:TPR repeat protein
MRALVAALVVLAAVPAGATECNRECDRGARDEHKCCLRPADFARRRKACDAHDPEACVLLARHLASGAGAPIDSAEARRVGDLARTIFEERCARGDGQACLRAAQLREPTDDAAIPLFERACELGAIGGCVSAGWAYETGHGRDDQRAARLYLKGCDAGDAASCYQQGLSDPDPELAKKLLDRACALGGAGGAPACTVRKSYARAFALYLAACDDDDGLACSMAVDLVDGTHVKASEKRIEELTRRACALGYGSACAHLIPGHAPPPP